MHTRRGFLGGLTASALLLNHSTQARACWKTWRRRHFGYALSNASYEAPTFTNDFIN